MLNRATGRGADARETAMGLRHPGISPSREDAAVIGACRWLRLRKARKQVMDAKVRVLDVNRRIRCNV